MPTDPSACAERRAIVRGAAPAASNPNNTGGEMARNWFLSPANLAPVAALSRVGWLHIARLALGGFIVGFFSGVYAGALFGLVGAACTTDISMALDGALIGGAALALVGTAYGLALGCTESDPHALADTPTAAIERSASQNVDPQQAPPAGRLSQSDSPEMEHAHGR